MSRSPASPSTGRLGRGLLDLALLPVATLAVAALAGAALLRFGPLPAGDPLRGTLALLPLVAAAAGVLERAGCARGGRRIPPAVSALELAAGAALGILMAGRGALGLPLAEPVLAAGLALLLFERLGRQLLALRPLLGRRLPRRPSALFFFLPLTAYLAILPWSTDQRPLDGDEPYYLLITHSLAHDLDAELSNNYALGHSLHYMERAIEPQAGDPEGPQGEKYSRHNELLPLALVPAYLAAGRLGALATMAVLAAALAWMTLRLAHRYTPASPGGALLAYGLLSLAPPLLLYSHQIWVEVPAALLSMIALDQILDRRRAPRGENDLAPWELRRWLRVGLPLLLLPLVKIRFMLLSVPLLGLAWGYSRRPRRPLLVLLALLGLLGVGILVYNQVQYGNPLKIHSVEELALHERPLANYLEGGLGLLFDSGFGLFACAPLWLLALPALVRMAWRRERLPRDLAVFALPYLAVVAPRMEWYGGWSPPFRYGLFCLPLAAVALAPLLEKRRRLGARALLALLGAATLALALLWIAVPGWTYNFADGRTYLLDHVSRQLGADVARLFPSFVRPRLATWVWPVLAAAAAALLWRWPGRRVRAVRHATAAGLVALLAAAAIVPFAAARLPTRIVEAEDAQVAKRGGHPHPDRWVIERTRYRGGWVLRPRESLAAPVVAGGERVRLALDVKFVRNSDWPLELEVRAGDRTLGTWTPSEDRRWQRVELGPFPWPAGAPLVLAVTAPSPPEARLLNGVIVDRAELAWLDP